MRLPLAALLALVPIGVGLAAAANAPSSARTKPNSSPGAIALIADRRVEEADIRRAASVMAQDPIRTRQHAVWRKKLLDLCVDRELLALEAERKGFPADATVKHDLEIGNAQILSSAIRDKYLIPEITPSRSQIDTARAGGLFRRVKMGYILCVTDRKTTYELLDAMKHGADFDSIAALYSTHPSATKGGEVGWRRVGNLNEESWRAFSTAKPGDIMGPYRNAQSHEFYRVETIVDPDDKEIREAMMHDRLFDLDSHYRIHLLQKYHFKLDPDQIGPIMFAAATEKADSILASLDSRGRRPKRGVRPSLGVIARVDGDSITYRDLAHPELLPADEENNAKIENAKVLLRVCTNAVLPRLIARDARERGIDLDPLVVRKLRLLREEISTRAMVTRAVPAPDSTALRAFFEAHASRYKRPAARRAFVTVFGSADTARMARAGWDRAQFRDSVLAADGFRAAVNAAATRIFPRFYGEISVFDADPDPLSVAVRGLWDGAISSVIETPNGYAVAKALAHEPPRPLSFTEARLDVSADALEHLENEWVTGELERLRVATPARTVPARLDAVRLGMSSDTGGNR